MQQKAKCHLSLELVINMHLNHQILGIKVLQFIKHVGEIIGIFFSLISSLGLDLWNAIVFCDRVLPLLCSFLVRIGINLDMV